MRFLLSIMLVAISPGVLLAHSIRVGDRVRFLQGEHVIQGTVLSIEDGQLSLQPDRTKETMTINQLRELDIERSLGTKTHGGSGLLVGSMAGLVLGFIAVAAAAEDPPSQEALILINPEPFYAVGILMTTVGGAILGGIIGSGIETELWEPSHFSDAAIEFGTRDGAPSVAFEMRF